MKELEAQKILRDLLTEQFTSQNQEVKILVGNEFKNISTHWAEKPDLVIFHKIHFQTPNMKTKILESPIGLEYKNESTLDSITKGVVVQLQKNYLNKKYFNRTTKTKFELKSLAFTNLNAVKNGLLYTRNFPQAANFFIERFCWKGNVAVILKEKRNGLIFSHRNYYFTLAGKPYMEHSRFWLDDNELEEFKKNQVVM